MSFSREFDFGPLNAIVNPADGQLYVIGFQVWGTTAKRLSGISRVRYTKELLRAMIPLQKAGQIPSIPLIGPRTLAELDDSIKAFDIKLTPEQVKWLEG